MHHPCPDMAIDSASIASGHPTAPFVMKCIHVLFAHTHLSAFSCLIHLSAHLVLIFYSSPPLNLILTHTLLGLMPIKQSLHPNHPLFSQVLHPHSPPHPPTLLSENSPSMTHTLHLPTPTSLVHCSLARVLPPHPMKLLLLISVNFSMLDFSVRVSILPLLVTSKPSQTGSL